METKIEDTLRAKKRSDIFFWISASFLITVGIIANSFFAELAIALRLAGWIILAAVVIFLILRTSQGSKLWSFSKAARVELRKVVWPKRQETRHITMIVIALVVMMAFLLWGIDSILLWALSFLTGTR